MLHCSFVKLKSIQFHSNVVDVLIYCLVVGLENDTKSRNGGL